MGYFPLFGLVFTVDITMFWQPKSIPKTSDIFNKNRFVILSVILCKLHVLECHLELIRIEVGI